MKNIWLKILLVILMLVPVPFSCKDHNECMDLYVEPYYSAQDMKFQWVDRYWVNQNTDAIMFDRVDQDYDNIEYPGDSLALYFQVPDTALLYHSKNTIKTGFSFTQDVFACNSNRPGYAGTRDLVDKIYISSNYDFDETHGKDYDLSDIVKIFAYTADGKNSWMLLSEYNKSSPYEAPKRFHLLITRKPTISKTQEFVVKYYMKNDPGVQSKYFIMPTPVFQLR